MRRGWHIAFAALAMGAWPAAAQLIGPWRGASSVAAGGYHSLGLKSDGSIVAWGDNRQGQINVPEPNTDFVGVAAGNIHSLALKSDGRIVAWGNNNYGQTNVPAPNADFVAVAAGGYHSLGLKSDGRIVAWGNNNHGQTNVPAPNADFVAMAAGFDHSMGVKSNGSVVAWGNANYGKTNAPSPNSNSVTVAAGAYHSLCLKSNGSVVAWGNANYGQTDVPPPNSNFVAVAAGWYHSVGLKSDGNIVGWGDNSYLQMNVPAPNSNFVAVAAGDFHSLGLKADGSIVAWLWNYWGQTDVPEPNTDFGQQSGVVPSKALTNGGATVTIMGSNLGNGWDVTNVTLCGIRATIVTQNSWRVVVQTGPAAAPTNGDVVVYSASYGTIRQTNAFTYFIAANTTNGTPQIWLDKYGLTNDLTDTDGDGMTEWKEYIAGTDPTSSGSVFRVLSSGTADVPTNEFVIHWSSASNRFYSIYSRSNLLEGNWSLITNNLPATPMENVYTDIVSQAEKLRLYRLGVTNAP